MGKIFEKIAAKKIATAGVQCGAIANNQMGGQAQNSAIDALLKALGRIAMDLGKHLNYSKKKPLRPTVLTHDIEGVFNNTHLKHLVQVMH
jgi:histone H3/H4